jgi:hypothetical protein
MRPLAHVALEPAAPALEPVPAADNVLLAPLPPVPLLVVPALPPVASGWSLDEPEAPGELAPDSPLPMWASQPWLSPILTSTAHFHKRFAEARQVEKSITYSVTELAPRHAPRRARGAFFAPIEPVPGCRVAAPIQTRSTAVQAAFVMGLS